MDNYHLTVCPTKNPKIHQLSIIITITIITDGTTSLINIIFTATITTSLTTIIYDKTAINKLIR